VAAPVYGAAKQHHVTFDPIGRHLVPNSACVVANGFTRTDDIPKDKLTDRKNIFKLHLFIEKISESMSDPVSMMRKHLYLHTQVKLRIGDE
jgi:hypothetical protein